MGRVQL